MNLPDAVVKKIVVNCSQQTAFRVWTEQIDSWWPQGHSLSGDPDKQMFMELGMGGRVYEKTAVGTEHNIGEIVAWQPHFHLAFNWYLGSDASRPSRVNVHFNPIGNAVTEVHLEHRGPDFIGELWESRIDKFDGAWDAILPRYQAIASAG